MNIRIGTRRSDLARFQAKYVAALLESIDPGLKLSFVFVSSPGDRDRRSALGRLGSIGAFTKESEDALLRGDADVIVHSLKDLPTTVMDGLVLAAVPQRHDPRDVLCGTTLDQLQAGTRVGTGSIRRRAQLLKLRPGIDIRPVRGNVPPRLRKAMTRDGIDATILAMAGLERLSLMSPENTFDILDPAVFPYAVGQGALGIEARRGDPALLELLARLEDAHTRAQVDAERSLMHALGAGCSLPVGVESRSEGGRLLLRAQVTRVDGSESIEGQAEGPASDALAMGEMLARDLIAGGAAALLKEATAWREAEAERSATHEI